ncbi:hypothetical protein Fluta_2204 [Fluviicola taffensis DSM 16823]|uniref:Uncharacterized protein n=1 Tax=Fluviicola taffensis (strain DSM 16823 / NCIMB 13979 / RW262) TaxID=755732 RepID=F2IAN5_FLUTR|nr:hypothetical protein Fluta_2204 [Fluviicola taffensis DSM 16823]
MNHLPLLYHYSQIESDLKTDLGKPFEIITGTLSIRVLDDLTRLSKAG